MDKKLIVANWKMNPNSLSEAKKLFLGIKNKASKLRNVQTVVCPPFVFIPNLKKMFSGHRIALGGQNLFYEEKGSFTGEISPSQLKDSGATYVILGHSERRAMGETNEIVSDKIEIALKHGFNVIFCIGEGDRDSHGQYLHFLREQITKALEKVKAKDLKNIVIAYEPIWAIGKTDDEAITPQKLHETTLFIKRVLIELYSKKFAMDIPVLYGGSVEKDNAEELLREGNVSGFLVGHASLEAKEFGEILEIANKN